MQRFFTDLPLRLLVILLGRLLPLLRSTATPGTPLIQASCKTAGKKAGPARIMHTVASVNPSEHSLQCFARSADVCGLRHFHLSFHPPITALAHFHPARKPAAGHMATHASRLELSCFLRYHLRQLMAMTLAIDHAAPCKDL